MQREGRAAVTSLKHRSAYVSIRQHTPAYASIRQHTSEDVSIRQHSSASHFSSLFFGGHVGCPAKGKMKICPEYTPNTLPGVGVGPGRWSGLTDSMGRARGVRTEEMMEKKKKRRKERK